MKRNKAKSLYAFESGRELYNPGVKFCYNYDHTTQKHLACYCSKCFRKFGDFILQSHAFVRVESTNVPAKILDNQIIKPQSFVEDVNLPCKKCGENTLHYIVDAGIGKVLQLLNTKGYKTMFSCEGHGLDFQSGEMQCHISYSILML